MAIGTSRISLVGVKMEVPLAVGLRTRRPGDKAKTAKIPLAASASPIMHEGRRRRMADVLTLSEIDPRIIFHADDEIMEVNFD